MAMHGVPHDRAAELNDFYAPYREKRNVRNRKMVDAVNNMMGKYGVTVDFEKDVLPLSNFARGGSVTERHLSSALAYRMLDVIGRGEKLARFIHEELKLPLSGRIEGYLTDEANPFMMYDLLGWIKGQLISKFYIDATDELSGCARYSGAVRPPGCDLRIRLSGRRGRQRDRRQARPEVRGRFPGRADRLCGADRLSAP